MAVTTIASSMDCPGAYGVFYDSVHDFVYAACYSGGVIAVNNATVTTIASSNDCPYPQSVSYDFVRIVVYAACYYGGVIAVNSRTVTTIASSSDCPFPQSVVYDSVHDVVYAACYSGGVIAVDSTTVTTIASSSDCPGAYSVFYDSVHAVAYAACSGGGVIAVNSTTVTTIASSTDCPNPYSVFYDSVHDVVYAACYGGGVIAVNDITTTTIASSTDCPLPQSVFYDSVHDIVYAACFNGGVIAVNSTTVTTIASSTDCLNSTSVIYDALHDVVYAACYGGGVIAVNNATVATIASSNDCPVSTSVFYDSVHDVVYAACYGGGVIAVNNITTTAIASSTDCPYPQSVFYDFVHNIVYSACAYLIAIAAWKCPSGFGLSNGLNTDSCVSCLPGKFLSSNFSMSACLLCPVGSVATSPGRKSCQSCSPGTFANISGSLSCTPCPPGYFTNVSGGRICSSSCYPGYICPVGSSSGTTFPCGFAGVYCPGGRSLPVEVSPGNYSIGSLSENTRTGELPCEPGFACTGGVKNPCKPGFFANLSQSTECTPCGEGSFSQVFSSIGCAPCPIGKFSSSQGSLECQSCLLGTFNNCPGSTVCEPCPLGTMSGPQTGVTTCFNCTAGYFSPSEHTVECLPCPPSQYSLIAASTMCFSCPSTGVACNNGTITALPGYFLTTTSAIVTAATELVVVPCPQSSCVGGALGSLCAQHRIQSTENWLCGKCEEGYSDISGECIYCPSYNYAMIVGLLVASFVYVLFLHRSAQATDLNPLPILLYFVQIVPLVLGPMNKYMQWLSFTQMQATSHSSDSAFSFPCIGPFSGIDGYKLAYIIPSILFAQLMLLWIIIRVLASCNILEDNGIQKFSWLPTSNDAFVRSTVSLLSYTYTGICTSTISWFQCVTVDDHRVVYSNAAIDCDSREYTQFSVIIYLVLVLDVIGVPLGTFCFLFCFREHIFLFHKYRSNLKVASRSARALTPHPVLAPDEPVALSPRFGLSENASSACTASEEVPVVANIDHSASPSTSHVSQPVRSVSLATRYVSRQLNIMVNRLPLSFPNTAEFAFLRRFGILFQDFHSDYYWWLVVVLIRRALSSVIAVSLDFDVPDRSLCFFLLHFISVLRAFVFIPYRHRLINMMETLSFCSLTLLSAIVAAYSVPPYPESVQIVVCFVVSLTTLCGLFVVVLNYYVSWSAKKIRAQEQVQMQAPHPPASVPMDNEIIFHSSVEN